MTETVGKNANEIKRILKSLMCIIYVMRIHRGAFKVTIQSIY